MLFPFDLQDGVGGYVGIFLLVKRLGIVADPAPMSQTSRGIRPPLPGPAPAELPRKTIKTEVERGGVQTSSTEYCP